MKHFFTTIIFLIVFSVQWVWAQNKVNIGATWVATTYNADTEVTLTESSVSLTGQITIAEGKTLTIKNGTNGPVTITNNGIYENMKRMFFIHTKAKLNIEGTSGKEIIVDGGADFECVAENEKNMETLKTSTHWLKFKGKNNGPDHTANDENEAYKKEQGTLEEAIYSRGTLNLKYVTIQNVYGRSNGGAILVTGYRGSNDYVENGPTTLTNCVIQKCFAQNGSAIQFTQQKENANNTATGCAVTLENTIVQYCETRGINNQAAPGGTIRTNGNTVGNLNLYNVTMQYNRSFPPHDADETIKAEPEKDNTKTTGVGNGCAVYWNASGTADTKCTIDGCTFTNNITGASGGALMLECNFEFTSTKTGKRTLVENNYAAYCGGGIIITAYNGGADMSHIPDLIFDFNLKDLEVKNNTANKGGGIAFTFMKTTLPEGSTLRTIVNGATLTSNMATYGGGMYFINRTEEKKGQIWFEEISIQLNHGELSANKATDGGAIYALNQDITSEKTNGKELLISGNSADQNGGGIYLSEGEISIASGTISGNSAGHYGGGLYVHNDASKDIAFTGGTFTGNSAYAGGGACVDGPVTLTVTNSNFESNTAKVGGGICLTGGTSSSKATMTYNSGRIRNNTANASDNNDTGITGGTPTGFTTAYQQGISDGLEGIGGGVFLDSYSSLTFGGNTNTPIGLYGNLAYNGADDIFANGLGTSVHLPNVTGMQLDDFKVPVDPQYLYWVKDYITGDTDYDNASKMDDEQKYTGSASVKRYRYALSSMSENDLYWKLSPATYTGYVSVALGYEVIYATINKYGLDLDKGENSIFTLTKGNDEKPYMRMVVSKENAVTNSTGETYISKRIALPAGTWTIEETTWSWAYELTLPDEDNLGQKEGNSYTRELTQATTKGNGNVAVFNFRNTKKSGITELRMENIKVNKMNSSY